MRSSILPVFPLLLAAYGLFGPGVARADEPDSFVRMGIDAGERAVAEIRRLIDEANGCPPTFVRPAGAAFLGREYWLGYFRQTRCEDLFSETPPKWLTSERVSPWYPMCSMGDLLERGFKPGQSDFAKAQAKSVAHLHELDHCEEPSEAGQAEEGAAPAKPTMTAQKSPAASAKPAEKEDPAPTLLTSEERSQTLEKARSIQQQVAQRCCVAGDAQCLRLVTQVEIGWCEPKTGEEAEKEGHDHCDELATFMTTDAQDERENAFYAKTANGKDAEGRFPFPLGNEPVGVILLPPYKDDEGPQSNLRDVTHEIGHACSQVRRALAVDRGVPGAFAGYRAESDPQLFDADGKPGIGCALSAERKSRYGALFAQVGASEETARCAADYSATATHFSYDSQKACAGGCPTNHLDESFADWIAFADGPESMRVPEITPDLWCTTFRDGDHPLGHDELKCFLRTPAFRKRIEEETQCRS